MDLGNLIDHAAGGNAITIIAIMGLMLALQCVSLLKDAVPFVLRKMQGKNGTSTMRGQLDHLINRIDPIAERAIRTEDAVEAMRGDLERIERRVDSTEASVHAAETKFAGLFCQHAHSKCPEIRAGK